MPAAVADTVESKLSILPSGCERECYQAAWTDGYRRNFKTVESSLAGGFMADQEHVGARIAALRKTRGWTGRELARRATVSYSLLAKVESGAAPASPALIGAVARALRVDVPRVTGQPYAESRGQAGRLHDCGERHPAQRRHLRHARREHRAPAVPGSSPQTSRGFRLWGSRPSSCRSEQRPWSPGRAAPSPWSPCRGRSARHCSPCWPRHIPARRSSPASLATSTSATGWWSGSGGHRNCPGTRCGRNGSAGSARGR